MTTWIEGEDRQADLAIFLVEIGDGMNAVPIPDRYKLLHGPYTPPAVQVSVRATWLYRAADVVITSGMAVSKLE